MRKCWLQHCFNPVDCMMCDKQLPEKFWKPEGQFYLLTSPENKTKGTGVEGEKKTKAKLNSISGEFIEL